MALPPPLPEVEPDDDEEPHATTADMTAAAPMIGKILREVYGKKNPVENEEMEEDSSD